MIALYLLLGLWSWLKLTIGMVLMPSYFHSQFIFGWMERDTASMPVLLKLITFIPVVMARTGAGHLSIIALHPLYVLRVRDTALINEKINISIMSSYTKLIPCNTR